MMRVVCLISKVFVSSCFSILSIRGINKKVVCKVSGSRYRLTKYVAIFAKINPVPIKRVGKLAEDKVFIA